MNHNFIELNVSKMSNKQLLDHYRTVTDRKRKEYLYLNWPLSEEVDKAYQQAMEVEMDKREIVYSVKLKAVV